MMNPKEMPLQTNRSVVAVFVAAELVFAAFFSAYVPLFEHDGARLLFPDVKHDLKVSLEKCLLMLHDC